MCLIVYQQPVGGPLLPARRMHQANHRDIMLQIGRINDPFDGVLLLKFGSECLRLETGYMRKLYACNKVLVPCWELIWIFMRCTVKL